MYTCAAREELLRHLLERLVSGTSVVSRCISCLAHVVQRPFQVSNLSRISHSDGPARSPTVPPSADEGGWEEPMELATPLQEVALLPTPFLSSGETDEEAEPFNVSRSPSPEMTTSPTITRSPSPTLYIDPRAGYEGGDAVSNVTLHKGMEANKQ